MIPLRDHNPSETTPIVTYILIALNVLIFLFMNTLSQGALEEFVRTYALIPADIISGSNLLTLLTSMFLHGGWAHLLGNMLFLFIFGDNLEDAFGHLGFLAFYLISGLAASALQIATDPGSTIPNLGASGAIAGAMGGYLTLFPHHRVDVLIPFGGFLQRSTVPAFAMLFYWFVIQFFQGIGSIGAPGGGVAYFAHVGGFIAGVVLAFLLKGFIKDKRR